jgi:multimeric flavodoxin WrbA
MTELNSFKTYLRSKKKVLFLTTSNRWSGEGISAKSTQLAFDIAAEIKSVDIRVIDVSKLKIHDCEGNISSLKGNNCGVKESTLSDKQKNPTGCHRCWASVNHPDDELWKVSQALLESDAVVFFVSTRWGQTNGIYQRLIERLSWIENRWTTLEEDNIVKDIDAGMILIGQNWNGSQVLQTQKNVLTFFGFKAPSELFLNWQYTEDINDESAESYLAAPYAFQNVFKVLLKGLKKSKSSLSKYVNTYMDFFPNREEK